MREKGYTPQVFRVFRVFRGSCRFVEGQDADAYFFQCRRAQR